MEESKGPVGKCFGSAVIGPRGQLVVPIEARRELGMDTGTRLLAFDVLSGQGVLFIKVEALEELINDMSQRAREFTNMLNKHVATEGRI